MRYFNRFGPPDDAVRIENAVKLLVSAMTGARADAMRFYPVQRTLEEREEHMPEVDNLEAFALAFGVPAGKIARETDETEKLTDGV